MEKTEELALRYTKVQQEAFSKVVTLYSEGLPDGQTAINFGNE